MKKEKRINELRGHIVLAVLALLVIAAGIAAVVHFMPTKKHMTAEAYYGLTGENEIAVIVNDTISETPGRLIDGVPYLPYEIVASCVNKAIYYDVDAVKLIFTTPTVRYTYDLSQSYTENREAVLVNGELFISLAYVKSVTALDAHYYEDPGREVIRTNGTFRTAAFSENAAVRYRAGRKSPILRDMEEGDQVILLDGSEVEGWTYVMTYNGYKGYVREGVLSAEEEKTISDTAPYGDYTTADTGIDGKINMVFHQTTNKDSNKALVDSIRKVDGVNVIAPTWFYLNSREGDVTNLSSKAYTAKAHKYGMKVWAVLNDFDGAVNSSDDTAAMLNSLEARTALIDTVVSAVRASGADGINVDFEKVREGSSAAFSEFIRELSIECRNAGLVLSLDLYVPTYTGYLDREELGKVTDYVVVMCYDEHTSGSEEAGSVASLPFVEKGIENTLTTVPKEKLIAAIPFYTRVWMTEGEGTPSSKALGMAAAAAYVEEHAMTTSWDEEAGQMLAEGTDGSTKLAIWLEDSRSIEKKMEVIQAEEIAGVAAWKLGLETNDIWQSISTFLE